MNSAGPSGTATQSPLAAERWYEMKLLWLGIAIFVASLAGCIGMVVIAARYPDEPLPVRSENLLKMPTAHTFENAPASGLEPSR